MSFYTSNGYYFKNPVESSSNGSKYVFDATKSNDRNVNVPEIGSTIYETIPTGGETFFHGSFSNKPTESGTRTVRKTGLGISRPKNFSVSKGRTQVSGSNIRSDRILRIDSKRKMKSEKNEIIGKSGKSLYQDLISRKPCTLGRNVYYTNTFRRARDYQIQHGNKLGAGRQRAVGPLYDGTDMSSRRLEIVEEGVPRRERIIRLRTGVPAMAIDETPQCFLQLPISVVTEQYIRITTNIRQTWLHTTIYIYATNEKGYLNIHQLNKMFTKAPLINRESSETEWDKRSQNLDEEIFVQNNIIKIRRSILIYDLQDGKQMITNDRRSYYNLCPAELSDATQREIYGNTALEPQSTLSVTTICGKQQYISGNIRLIEKLLITLSNGRESEGSQRLQRRIERQIMKPDDIPVQYFEDVLIGPRRIDIFRKAEIKPSEGLSEFITAKKRRIFEFTEIRRYDSNRIYAPQAEIYYLQRPSLMRTEEKTSDDQSAPTTARSTPSHLSSLSSSRFSDDSSYAFRKRQLPISIGEQVGSIKSSQLPSRHLLQLPEATDKQQFEEQISVQKIEPIIQGLNTNGTSIITGIVETGISTKPKQQQKLFAKQEKSIEKTYLKRGSQHSSRWTRFGQPKPSTSTSTTTPVPIGFSPLYTSTPHPEKAEDLPERKSLSMEKITKTLRNKSAGTGTHIRSTLDCDITHVSVGTIKEAKVTSIPIEILGDLNGFPWSTTIRLRIKHNANERPIFIPKRISLDEKVIWQDED